MNSEVLESLRIGVKFLEARDQIPPRHFEASNVFKFYLTSSALSSKFWDQKKALHVLLGLSLLTDKACLDKVEKDFKSLEETQKPR